MTDHLFTSRLPQHLSPPYELFRCIAAGFFSRYGTTRALFEEIPSAFEPHLPRPSLHAGFVIHILHHTTTTKHGRDTEL